MSGFDMVAFFEGATDMIDYLHTIDLVNIVINTFFTVAGVLLAIAVYWAVTSGGDD